MKNKVKNKAEKECNHLSKKEIVSMNKNDLKEKML